MGVLPIDSIRLWPFTGTPFQRKSESAGRMTGAAKIYRM
jgi:hypothetical protein